MAGALALAVLGRGCVRPAAWEGAALAGTGPGREGSVKMILEPIAEGGVVSFGLPLPPDAVTDVSSIRVGLGPQRKPVGGLRARPLLFNYDVTGTPQSVQSALIQFDPPISGIGGSEIEVTWRPRTQPPAGEPPRLETRPYVEVRVQSKESVEVVGRRVDRVGVGYRLVETAPRTRVLFSGWEPRILALIPDDHLAGSGLYGALVTRSQLRRDPGVEGLTFLSDNLILFVQSALYEDGYQPTDGGGDPHAEAVVDPIQNYEGWLYDRCATLLLAHAHTGDARFLRAGLRACSFYASTIDDAGFFAVPLEKGGRLRDPKYSHNRGLYLYYALTGDEAGREAGRRIARLWLNDVSFVRSYREGRLRGPDRLWTERLLATSLEGLVYGYLLTGEAELLRALRELFETAYTHVTTSDPGRLSAITGTAFPPQDCFVHSEAQHDEGSPENPWCSGWMSEMLVDPLLRYQALTGDERVDEVFVRLGRFLRDTGTVYTSGSPLGDSFLKPKACYDPAKQGDSVRMLIPAYGAGLRPDRSRYLSAEDNDFNHCVDATALTAAALRALKRQGRYDAPGVGPFSTERASLEALHHELAFCAQRTFAYFSRTGRDPSKWTSDSLAEGFGKPEWVGNNKIGFPSYPTSPQRKLSWWFNTSLLQFGLLRDAGITLSVLKPGAVEPRPCP